MRNQAFPLALLLATAIAGPARAQDDTAVSLLVGRSQVVATHAALTRVAVSNPKVASVRVISAHELLVQALHPGATTVVVWTQDGAPRSYDVTIGLDVDAVQRQVRALTGNKDFSIAFNGNAYLLSGDASTPAQKDAAERIVASFGAPVVNLAQVPAVRDQIEIDVEMLELAKTASLNLGLEFGGGNVSAVNNGIRQYVFQAGQVMTGEATAGNLSTFGQIDFLATQINALQNRGLARMLARPKLVTTNGGTARFLAGGEIPIPVQQSLGTTTIEWKEFGVRLECSPTLTPSGRVLLTVKPEVSSLDYTNALKQASFTIPAIKSRRAETQVLLAPSQTLMLGGLLDSEQTRGYDQLPGLGDIPVLGELFRSRQFQDNQTELAILVTPRLVAPGDSPVSAPLDAVRHDMQPGVQGRGMLP